MLYNKWAKTPCLNTVNTEQLLMVACSRGVQLCRVGAASSISNLLWAGSASSSGAGAPAITRQQWEWTECAAAVSWCWNVLSVLISWCWSDPNHKTSSSVWHCWADKISFYKLTEKELQFMFIIILWVILSPRLSARCPHYHQQSRLWL